MKYHALIIDSTSGDIDFLTPVFEKEGIGLTAVSDGEKALSFILEGKVDLVITDTVLKKVGGREIVNSILTNHPQLPVFIRTDRGSVEEAFQYAKLGVRDYFLKNESPEELVSSIIEELEEENQKTGSALPFSQFVSKNAETTAVFKKAIERVAKTPSTVLITGESGTGKELLARTIHHFSDRSSSKWVAVNCAALPENLIESELFGHEKGSFTGATTKRIGRFEQANNGTFFLDEVGDLSLYVQTKLLRVIQERTIERVGGNKPIPINVRIVAATHRNLRTMVKKKRFREDLFYRLSVINLELPSLRERPEDIAGLSRYFIERFRKDTGRDQMILTPRAERAMVNYTWPGNVRELENAIEGAVVLSSNRTLDLEDLPDEVQRSSKERSTNITLKVAREQFEKEFIIHALSLNDGNVSATSLQLDIARKNLQEKIKKFDIDVEALRQKAGK